MLQILCKKISPLQFFFCSYLQLIIYCKSIISLSFEAKLQKNTSSFSIFNHFANIVQKIMGPLQIFYGTRPEFISYGIMYHPTKFGSCIIFCTKLTYFLSYSPYYVQMFTLSRNSKLFKIYTYNTNYIFFILFGLWSRKDTIKK